MTLQAKPTHKNKTQILFNHKAKFSLRKAVFEKNNFTCVICGWTPLKVPTKYDGKNTVMSAHNGTLVWLEVDHIKSRVKGGDHDITNLQTMCNKCNCSKGGS